MEQGCEYCKGEKDLPLETDIGHTWIDGNMMENAYGEMEIKFCPICGRDLSTISREKGNR